MAPCMKGEKKNQQTFQQKTRTLSLERCSIGSRRLGALGVIYAGDPAESPWQTSVWQVRASEEAAEVEGEHKIDSGKKKNKKKKSKNQRSRK